LASSAARSCLAFSSSNALRSTSSGLGDGLLFIVTTAAAAAASKAQASQLLVLDFTSRTSRRVSIMLVPPTDRLSGGILINQGVVVGVAGGGAGCPQCGLASKPPPLALTPNTPEQPRRLDAVGVRPRKQAKNLNDMCGARCPDLSKGM